MKTDQIRTEPLVVERTYDAKVDKVWQALTDINKMKQWYFDVDDFKPEPGFEFHFHGENEGRQFLHICVVKEAIANKKIAYSWKYKNYPGESLVTFELFDEGDKTRLKLTHTGLDTFPSENPDFSVSNFTMGWTHIIGIALPEYLAKA
ncbi:MAG TPA: SRPBCC domain-containing protein [Mucilaginibacter sp.]|jgi:uncharacterized protein YndB with AHSA1/START domain